MNVLEEILASTRVEVERRRRETPESALQAGGDRRRQAFRDAIAGPGLSIIAEHKRRSPSAGAIRPGSSVTEIARAYEHGGAAAISVLTEEQHFGGSLEDLREAHAACRLPLLRKDFIIDSYQLAEAACAGASAVLLIVAALEHATLGALRAEADERGLDVLVEVHDAAELEVALGVGAEIIGVNNRDLRDFSVDLERTFELLGVMPSDAIVVAESGITTPEHLARLRDHGVHAALIGERLMRADDPGLALATLTRLAAV
jgi:indole-3-glycerol phosphate synthase